MDVSWVISFIFLQFSQGTTTKFESGLKLFLSKFDMERLYDFEEEGIDGLMRMKEEEAMQNTEAKMKNLLDTAEELKAKLDDLTRYEIINQVGLDLQYTQDAWLWKLEAIARSGHGSPFFAAVGGFEYTFFQVFESKADLGILMEYLYDGRDEEAPPTAFENDVFAGARLALNDTQDTSVLAGAIYDPSDSTAAILVEAERRLGENWKVELEARLFAGSTEGSDSFQQLGEDGFVGLRVSRHF